MTKQYTEHLELILNESDETVAFKPDYQATLQKLDAYAATVDAVLGPLASTPAGLTAEATARAQADAVLQQSVNDLGAEIDLEVLARQTAVTQLTNTLGVQSAVIDASKSGSNTFLLANANLDLLIYGVIARDSNGAPTSANVRWPDGIFGTYTATSISTTFPGTVDAYTITYVSASTGTKTITQPVVTRDANGVVTNRPLLTITATTAPSGVYTATYGASY